MFFSPYLRRNLPGDRAKALDIMIPLVQSEGQVASDMYCLVGRIYKDIFLDSNFMDTESRDNGAFWWVRRIRCLTNVWHKKMFANWRVKLLLLSFRLCVMKWTLEFIALVNKFDEIHLIWQSKLGYIRWKDIFNIILKIYFIYNMTDISLWKIYKGLLKTWKKSWMNGKIYHVCGWEDLILKDVIILSRLFM